MIDIKTSVLGMVLCFIVGGIGGAVWVTEKFAPEFTKTSSVTSDLVSDTRETSDIVHAMDTMTDNLKDKTGEALDRAFLEDMITHHEGAVEMAQMVSSSVRKELRNLSNIIIKTQTREIAQMRQWLQEWYR